MDIQVAVKYSNWPQIYGKLYVALFGCNITMLVAGTVGEFHYPTAPEKFPFGLPQGSWIVFHPSFPAAMFFVGRVNQGTVSWPRKTWWDHGAKSWLVNRILANKSTWAVKQTSVCMAYVIGRIDYLKLWALGGYEHIYMNIYETYIGSLYLPCMGGLTHYLMAYWLYCVIFVHDMGIPMPVSNK